MNTLPSFIQNILHTLHEKKHEAYAVGGCVRDMLRGAEPKDWDITTNATPEQIQKIFPESFYNNQFGTVGVKTDSGIVEITPYRSEGQYSDRRHPDEVKFGVSLEEDLQRRDFTINAMAYDGKNITDLFDGQKDLTKKVIRAVGDPQERFQEDGLRLIRACRFAAQLGFDVEEKTYEAIQKQSRTIREISAERIRDEFIKLIESDNPLYGVWLLHTTGLLKTIIPELEEGFDMEQNLHHIYTVFFHNLMSLQYCPSDDYRLRIASLLHDVGKSRTKKGHGRTATFHMHEQVGGRMTRAILKRLRFSREDIEKITHLVSHHMFYYSVDEITDAGVRRLIKRIGPEHIRDILIIRIADRMGSGCQAEVPFKLKELQKRIEKVSKDPITTAMLAINGHDLMKEFKVEEGPMIGLILNALLEEVLDDVSKNNREYLLKKSKDIYEESSKKSALSLKRKQDKKLKEKLDSLEKEEDKKLNKKYFGK